LRGHHYEVSKYRKIDTGSQGFTLNIKIFSGCKDSFWNLASRLKLYGAFTWREVERVF